MDKNTKPRETEEHAGHKALGFELTSAWLQRPCSFTDNKRHKSVRKNGEGRTGGP